MNIQTRRTLRDTLGGNLTNAAVDAALAQHDGTELGDASIVHFDPNNAHAAA